MEATQISIDRQMDKEDMKYIQWNIPQLIKRMRSCHLQQHGWIQRYIAK